METIDSSILPEVQTKSTKRDKLCTGCVFFVYGAVMFGVGYYVKWKVLSDECHIQDGSFL